MSIVMLFILFVTASLGNVLAEQYPYPVNCGEPRLCSYNVGAHCIKGRSGPVYGHCDFQNAICNGEEWDPSNSCFLPYPLFCDLPPDQRPCYLDPQPWCVEGRSEPVRGHCAIQYAICDENAVVDTSNSCLRETSLLLR
ncbi:uncharacterized protein LOC112566791 [Pomacea canaliculata]|uniref:uncharacterized protein LOC112566791 n=1 Tax=Pomacea canaliculata TaxID=400727 RepID=UPI000D73807C|nr:uncharacterized protein LOC112566791 [Pomacea canaliculata]